jgi:maltose alpha-D-glucosyltransferase/alpha-amylase
MKLDDKLHWYKDAIIYELHIKAFRDSNGDGIGDLKGLIEKLDQLVELGITAIWLLPFYPSPLRDDGYDIADYYNINQAYGDIGHFKEFLSEAHKRKLKVITELVLNHTSDQHPWFQRARRAPRDSNERAYYVWSDDATRYQDVRIIFQDFEASNWSWDEMAKQYYWHRFFHHQPDLNFDNPSVQEEIIQIIEFWCRLGVDGFRLDAVPYLYEREGTNCENLRETHGFLKRLRRFIDEKYPGTMLLAEANMWPEEAAAYFGNGDECHMNYHFPLMPRMYMAIQSEDRHAITDIFDQTPAIPQECQWAMFLRNHDELTLEMVTDEERDYMYRVYVRDKKARINLGIRHRLASLMENDRRKIELMNSLLFSMPGTPVIYYGDEIGMGDNFYLGDRDGVRTPMQWSADRNAGFSDALSPHLYLPVIQDPSYHYETINVESQRANTSSLYWFMKRMISIRKRHKAFGRGNIQFLNIENPKVLAFTRSYEGETLLAIANLSKFTQPCEVNLNEYAGNFPVEIFSKNRFPVIQEKTPYFFTLSPYGFQWFILNADEQRLAGIKKLPVIELEDVADLFSRERLRNLEKNIIPDYLEKAKWFSGDRSIFYDCRLEHYITIAGKQWPVNWFMLEVTFKAGLPETYHFPLVLVSESEGNKLVEVNPEAVIAGVMMKNEKGFLCDALYTENFQQWLVQQAIREDGENEGNQIRFTIDETVRKKLSAEKLYSRIYSASFQSNTAITYNNQYFLKIYRKVEANLHPDPEISGFLTKEARFPNVPVYYGMAELKTAKDVFPVALLQEMIENHGTAYSFMQERVQNYIERVLAFPKAGTPKFEIPPLLSLHSFTLGEAVTNLLGDRTITQVHLLGTRIAQLHHALGSSSSPAFAPEKFTMYYQRSLYAAMRKPFREAFSMMKRAIPSMQGHIRQQSEKLLSGERQVDEMLKRIYASRINTMKIRIHGNLNLPQLLLGGKDIFIHDFGGDPTRNISERRLKRSCLRDAASLVRSLYYVAYEGFIAPPNRPAEDLAGYMSFPGLWASSLSGIFLKSYFNTIGDSPLIPRSEEEIRTLLQVYLLEKAFYSLVYEINHRPLFAAIPVKIISSLLGDGRQ